MAETQEVYNPDQGSLDAPSPFAPSLASQASSLLGDNSPQAPPVEFKPEDLEGIFSMPFDAAAFIARRKIGAAGNDIELTKKELEQLCRIWAKPFGNLAARYPSFPWVIAGTMTMGIIVEKVLIFYIAKEEQEKYAKRNYDLAHKKEASKVEEISSAAQANL
jgi:hypothetical protein